MQGQNPLDMDVVIDFNLTGGLVSDILSAMYMVQKVSQEFTFHFLYNFSSIRNNIIEFDHLQTLIEVFPF